LVTLIGFETSELVQSFLGMATNVDAAVITRIKIHSHTKYESNYQTNIFLQYCVNTLISGVTCDEL